MVLRNVNVWSTLIGQRSLPILHATTALSAAYCRCCRVGSSWSWLGLCLLCLQPWQQQLYAAGAAKELRASYEGTYPYASRLSKVCIDTWQHAVAWLCRMHDVHAYYARARAASQRRASIHATFDGLPLLTAHRARARCPQGRCKSPPSPTWARAQTAAAAQQQALTPCTFWNWMSTTDCS